MHWITLSKVSREVDREVDCEAAYYHPERVWKLPCFDPFNKQTDLSAGNSRSLLASLTFRAGTPFFLTNPVQQHTGTKTLLLVETLSPINGELGPCRQYWLLLLFCGLRPSPTTSYPTAGITLTSSHAHGGLDRVVFQWKSILQMGSIY